MNRSAQAVPSGARTKRANFDAEEPDSFGNDRHVLAILIVPHREAARDARSNPPEVTQGARPVRELVSQRLEPVAPRMVGDATHSASNDRRDEHRRRALPVTSVVRSVPHIVSHRSG